MNFRQICNNCLGNINKFRLNEIYIISPYISSDFIKELKQLKPDKVWVVTDAGISENNSKQIQNILGNRLKKLRFAECQGIVHAKAYLLRWLNDDEEEKSIFLWGSCNATGAGFGKNAEIYSWVYRLSSISKLERNKLQSYFKSIKYYEKVEEVQIKIADNIIIHLPHLNFIKSTEENSFDLWIQKGILCHPFPKDSRFRHFKVKLLKNVGGNDPITKIFKRFGLKPVQQTTISHDYLRYGKARNSINEFKNTDNYSIKWKSQFFIDTIYGSWTSQECYREKGDYFKMKDSNRRAEEMKQIKTFTPSEKKEKIETFVNLLKKVSYDIDNPGDYFHFNDQGNFDRGEYKKNLKKQLDKDILRSNDTWFKNCYVSGYEFYDVPPLRNFSENWNEFVLSFCNALLFEIKNKKTNWLAKTLNSMHDFDEKDGAELLEWFRNDWKDIEDEIKTFYNFRK